MFVIVKFTIESFKIGRYSPIFQQEVYVIEKIYSNEDAKQVHKYLHDLDAELHEITSEFAYNKIWSREGLGTKERCIVTVSSLIAQGKAEQLRIHMKGFLNNNGTINELKEIIIHSIVYSGFPSALNAQKILNEIIKEKNA